MAKKKESGPVSLNAQLDKELSEAGATDYIKLAENCCDMDLVCVPTGFPQLDVILHPHNMGYGANQKTCYKEALARSADIVVMVHPDYQYDPRLVTAMAGMVASGIYDMVLNCVEKPVLDLVLDHADGNQSRAAEWLGINRNTLRKKMQQHGIK